MGCCVRYKNHVRDFVTPLNKKENIDMGASCPFRFSFYKLKSAVRHKVRQKEIVVWHYNGTMAALKIGIF